MLRAEAVHKHEDERRSCRRATLQWVVLVFFGGDQWGKLVDLSEKGMCFQFEHPPALRQSINFTFEAMGCMAIPSEGHEGSVFGDSIQATGRVKWTREFERTAGVEFLELSPRSRDQIRYWISSGASQEAAAPSRELQQEWNKKKSKKADRKTAPFTAAALAAPQAPVEPAPSPAKAPFEPREEVFESDPANAGSDIEVVWEAEPSLAPPTIDEPAISHRKWSGEAEPEDTYKSPTLEGPAAEHSRKWPLDAKSESAFAPPDFDEPAASAENWPAEPEPQLAPSFLPPTLDEATAVELREKLDALSHGKRTLEPEPEDSAMPPSLDEPVAHPGKWESRSEPAPAPEEFVPSDKRGFWGSKGAFASQPADFEVPGMLHHDERQRRGQTLELKQHRARFGVIAVLGLLATLGALAGIIRFTSKFNERADATDVSRPSENNVASSRAEAGAALAAKSPFLVEVVDANNHRSVIVFSTEARSNKSGHVQDSSLSETSVMAVQEPREETKTSATKQASRDFTLIAPHAASSLAGANSAVEAPALTTQAPASVEAPLQNLPSPAMPGAAERAPAVGGEVQPARLIHAVLPSYPQIARSSRVSGDVTLDALVDESGNVLDVKVIAGPLLLRDAAMVALRQWKYEPARLDGQPTPMHLTVTVKFQANLASH
ncbi:MAG TPA: TonB family protein [Candidatus Acidoferrum sp.]